MSRRFLLIGVPSALTVLAAGYGAFWWVAASRAVEGIDRWSRERRAEGWAVSHAPPRTGGFPLWLTLDIDRPRIEAPTREGGVVWRGSSLHARARPWRFRRIDFTAVGSHEARHVHLPSRQTVVSRTQGGRGTVEIGPNGRAREISISLTALSVTTPVTDDDIRIESVTASLTPSSNDGPPRSLRAIVSAVELPDGVWAPLGNLIRRIELATTVDGTLTPGPLPHALAAWRDAGGALEIERAAVRWGPLDVNARGRVSLDRDLQPVGELTVGAQGFNETLARLARNGQVESNDAAAVGLVMSLLARPGPDGAPRVTVPVSIRNRVVTAGPQTILRLPRIVWE